MAPTNSAPSARIATIGRETTPPWLLAKLCELEKLMALPKGWNGFAAAPPIEAAKSRASQFLRAAAAIDLAPDRIVPDAIGGIGIYFFRTTTETEVAQHFAASVTCQNSGHVIAEVARPAPRDADLWMVAETTSGLRQAARRILSAISE